MTKAFKKEMNKSLNRINEDIIKHVEEINKSVQELKVDVEPIKKTQTERILEMEKSKERTGTTDASITNKIQEMKKRISGVEDTIEETDISVKENVKSKKNHDTKHSGNLGYQEKT
jgi:chromosome segregation ATPase